MDFILFYFLNAIMLPPSNYYKKITNSLMSHDGGKYHNILFSNLLWIVLSGAGQLEKQVCGKKGNYSPIDDKKNRDIQQYRMNVLTEYYIFLTLLHFILPGSAVSSSRYLPSAA